ncbi:MAG: NAD(P)H-dependent glycerol-3-phosphate dehydrogenase [Bacteroidales bacterium]|nr:NAD(P)H-dependent glycerol-3-phosphate dehydrogenase [Bacteroidales bacterium]
MDRKITVIGDGSWATALIKLLTENEIHVNWFVRKPETINYLKSEGNNPEFLSGVKLNLKFISFFNNVEKAVEASSIILLVIPSEFLTSVLNGVSDNILKCKMIVSAVKGVIEEKNKTVCSYLNQHYQIPLSQLCVISGPSHAEEVAQEKLSYLTIASENQDFAAIISNFFARDYIRTILSDDVYGTEYSATLKNIMALGAGISQGLGYGDNFQAVLVSNAIREIKRFALAVYPIRRDINESAYLGDLLVTAYSEYSRNRSLGKKIGSGLPVAQALNEMKMVAEGYHATKCLYKTKKELEIEMPILEAVYRILFKNANPEIEIKSLTEKLR